MKNSHLEQEIEQYIKDNCGVDTVDIVTRFNEFRADITLGSLCELVRQNRVVREHVCGISYGYVYIVKKWHLISQTPPPVNVAIDTKIEDCNGARNEQQLKFDGKLWWTPDGSDYVYYTPTHWRL